MKKLLLLVLLTGFSYAQNADGINPSLHLSLYTTSGNIKATLMATTITPSATQEQDITGNLNFSLLLKIPLSNAITLSPFLRYESFEYGSVLHYKANSYDYGATLSFYIE
jgi:hypothetical protein